MCILLAFPHNMAVYQPHLALMLAATNGHEFDAGAGDDVLMCTNLAVRRCQASIQELSRFTRVFRACQHVNVLTNTSFERCLVEHPEFVSELMFSTFTGGNCREVTNLAQLHEEFRTELQARFDAGNVEGRSVEIFLRTAQLRQECYVRMTTGRKEWRENSLNGRPLGRRGFRRRPGMTEQADAILREYYNTNM